jgi:hypothetical protein
VAFLKMLRARDPGAYFVVWTTGSEEIEGEAKKVVELAKAQGESRISLVPVDGLEFTGCDYHPSLADDGVIRDKLEQAIDAVPGVWQGK